MVSIRGPKVQAVYLFQLKQKIILLKYAKVMKKGHIKICAYFFIKICGKNKILLIHKT